MKFLQLKEFPNDNVTFDSISNVPCTPYKFQEKYNNVI